MFKFAFTWVWLFSMTSTTVFDFNPLVNPQKWIVVDDGVMGGKSAGTFGLSPEGHGLFKGSVSLENYGGFSSVRYRFPRMDLGSSTKVWIRLKGDQKKYQFRVKSSSADQFSFVTTFSTSGEWELIEIPLAEMVPTFRGRSLNRPNFSEAFIEEVAFLIANKKEERFELLIDYIELK